MATPEQLKTWKREIAAGKNEIIFPGTSKEFEVKPAEKIRYQERRAFGELLVNDLVWLVSHDEEITEESLLAHQAALKASLRSELQKQKIDLVTETLLERMRQTKRLERRQLVQDLQEVMSTIYDGEYTFQFSSVAPEDIEVTTFGAVVVRIRDRAVWEHNLKHPASQEGFKFTVQSSVIDQARIKAFNRLIFLRAFEVDRFELDIEKSRLHELFHDLHWEVFSEELPNRYPPGTRRELFKMFRNELLAYAFSAHWNVDLTALLNKSAKGKTPYSKNQALHERLAKEVTKELEEAGVNADEAVIQANQFDVQLREIEGELIRLNLNQSQAFKEWIACLMTVEGMEDLVYQLTHIDPGPVDARKIPRRPDGTVDLWISDVFMIAIKYALPMEHRDSLIEAARLTYDREKASSTPDPKKIQHWEFLFDYVERNKDKFLS